MPRLKKKYMQPQLISPVSASVTAPTAYFQMRKGKKEVGVPFWTLYKLYQDGELPAAPLTSGKRATLYVRRSDFDALWEKKLRSTSKVSKAA